MKHKELFYWFLKKNNVSPILCLRRVVEFRNKEFVPAWAYRRTHECAYYIFNAFNWRYTIEGYQFWEDLNELWTDFYGNSNTQDFLL